MPLRRRPTGHQADTCVRVSRAWPFQEGALASWPKRNRPVLPGPGRRAKVSAEPALVGFSNEGFIHDPVRCYQD